MGVSCINEVLAQVGCERGLEGLTTSGLGDRGDQEKRHEKLETELQKRRQVPFPPECEQHQYDVQPQNKSGQDSHPESDLQCPESITGGV